MYTTRALCPRLLAAGVFLSSTIALAHTGMDGAAHHGASFMDGMFHPWVGLDHLAAMLAVGVWSAMTTTRWWVTPIAFASMLLAGAVLGMGGIVLAAVEPMIAASLLVLGLLVALRTRMPAAVSVAVVGVFAMFHGVAHGYELAGGTGAGAPLAGLLLGTLALHCMGVATGRTLCSRSVWWPRATGAAVLLFGGGLLLQMA